MRENIAQGAPPLEGYEHFRAFTNMDYVEAGDWFDGFRCFRELAAAYGGKFILNTRPVEHWVASVMAQDALRGIQEAHALKRFGTSDPAHIAEGWRALRERHHREVLADIAPERLLVFDIERDPPERLCDFIGVPRSHARFWRLENPTLGSLGRGVARLMPQVLKEAIPARFKVPVKRLLRKRR